jgi:nicotinamide riboside kinase
MHDMFKVVVTGPESTGKTEVCKFLASSYGTAYIPEYAREYIASLDCPYTFKDVERIAMAQVEQLRQYGEAKLSILFIDTYLIITKIWFREVYGHIPDWIDDYLEYAGIDLFLLCYHDIEWIPDPLRENPEPRRTFLYEAYLSEIKRLGRPFEVIRGRGTERFNNAKKAVGRHFADFKNER